MAMITEDSIYDSVRENYDRGAPEFARSRAFFFRDLEFIKKYPQKGDKILDFGSGNGRLIDFLEIDPANYRGVDVSAEMIKTAQAKNPDHSFWLINNNLAKTLPLGILFDWIFAVGVLHHLPPGPKREAILKELLSFLVPGGRFFVSVWDLHQKRYAKFLAGQKEAFIPFCSGTGKMIFRRYCYAFTLPELVKVLEEAGFKVIKSGHTFRKGRPANLFCLVEKGNR